MIYERAEFFFSIIHPLLVVLLLANFPKYVFLKKHPFKLNVNFGAREEAVCFVPWSISFLSISTITKNQCCLCQWSMAHTKKSWKYIFKIGTLQLYPSCKIQLKLCTPQKNLQKVKIQFPVNNHIGGKLLASITFLKIENSFSLVEWSSLCCPLILWEGLEVSNGPLIPKANTIFHCLK